MQVIIILPREINDHAWQTASTANNMQTSHQLLVCMLFNKFKQIKNCAVRINAQVTAFSIQIHLPCVQCLSVYIENFQVLVEKMN